MKIVLISVLAVFGFIFLLGLGSDSSSNNYASDYGRCKNSAETKFMIQAYKQKYPSISDSQIAHIICNK